MRKIKPKQSLGSARVYSYIRFSTPEQAMGGSERRQLDDAKAWAKKKGFEFDTSLRMTDRGFSSFHGDHRKSGALGKFLDLVRSEQVPRGSILVVENIDRLGREGVFKMLKSIIFDLIEHGITIQTLDPERAYDENSINGHQIYELIVDIQRAHRESEVKSNRRRWSWNKAREQLRDGKPAKTGLHPAWLRRKEDGTFEVIPEAAQTIRLIYELKQRGVSTRAIEARLNAEAPWTPPKNPKRKTGGWRHSYVRKILQDASVIGLYQPHEKKEGRRARVPLGEPIQRYPAAVATKLFHAVQAKLEQNRGTGGQTGKFWNLLRDLVKCAYCGGPMHRQDKGPLPKGGAYLYCANGIRGVVCARHRVRYDECEKVVLDNCPRLRPEEVLPKPAEQAKRCRFLRQRIQGTDSELQNIERKLDRLVEQIGDAQTPAIGQRLQAKMAELDEEKNELVAQRVADETDLRNAEHGLRSFTAWKASLAALKAEIAKGGNPELRMQVNSHLRELINKIEVFAVGHERVAHNGEDLAQRVDAGMGDVAPRFTRSKAFRGFLKYVTDRRMSKEGRFLRVHFTTGAVVELVPDGSIASGHEFRMEEDEEEDEKVQRWHFRSPSVERLWKKYRQRSDRLRS